MTSSPQDLAGSENAPHKVTVVGPDGQPIGEVEPTEIEDAAEVTDLVSSPAKVMRIGSMVKQLLDEVKSAPLDEAARVRLGEIHRQAIEELGEALAPELIDELNRLNAPFESPAPSEAELRIAQAQLVGWLEGLFHGIQAAIRRDATPSHGARRTSFGPRWSGSPKRRSIFVTDQCICALTETLRLCQPRNNFNKRLKNHHNNSRNSLRKETLMHLLLHAQVGR